MLEELTSTKEGMAIYQQERVVLEVTELICKLMKQRGVNKTELAKRLGKSKGYVTQLLDGQTNMTLRTVSDTFLALDSGFGVHVRPLNSWSIQPRYRRRKARPA